MNSIQFGSDLADVEIRIDLEIWIRIRNQILSSVEFALSECSRWICS